MDIYRFKIQATVMLEIAADCEPSAKAMAEEFMLILRPSEGFIAEANKRNRTIPFHAQPSYVVAASMHLPSPPKPQSNDA